MKSLEKMDEVIDKYYEGTMDESTSEEFEIKLALNKMDILNNIEQKVPISIDVSSIVNEGQEIAFNMKLKKDTFKFLMLAIVLVILVGISIAKMTLNLFVITQVVALISLTLLNYILITKDKRREISE